MWIYHYALMINEVSMVELNMFSNIAKQLVKARGFLSENTTMFGQLYIFVFIGEFYQFFPVISRLLWEDVCIEGDPYSKIL